MADFFNNTFNMTALPEDLVTMETAVVAEDLVTMDTGGAVGLGPGPGLGPGRGPGGPRDLHQLVEWGLRIQKYGIPSVAVVGLIGNSLSLCLMQRPYMKKSTPSVYFSFLAVLDAIHIVHIFLSGWCKRFLHFDIYGYYDVTCKMAYALTMIGLTTPAWLIVVLTTERFLVTHFPIRARWWCTKKVAVVASSLVCVTFAILWFSLILRFGVTSGSCDKATTRLVLNFLKDHGYILVITLYTLIPSPVLLILNAGLAYQVRQVQKFRKTLAGPTDDKGVSGITVMALSVSLTYMLLTMPAMIFLYMDMMVNNAAIHHSMKEPVWKFLRDISTVLRELNHAINFFIYLMVLPKMKTELAAMLLPCRKTTTSRTTSGKPPSSQSVRSVTKQTNISL